MEASSGSIPKLDWESGDLPTAWKTFRQHVQFTFDGPLKAKNEETKCNYLMLWVGDKGCDIYSTWNLQQAEAKVLQTYYDRFDNYVRPKSNKLYARYKFTTRKQSEAETFEQFVTDLRLLIKDCDYQQRDEMLRDQIVFAVKSAKIREKLISEGSDLTLEKAVDIARTYELSKQQVKSMNGEDSSIHALNRKPTARVQTSKAKGEHSKSTKYYQPERNKRDRNCGKCGRNHRRNERCPAEGKQCNKCFKMNHFASVCKTKSPQSRDARGKKKIHTVSETDTSSDDEFYVGTIDTPIHTIDNTWYETLKINDQPIRIQIDTGAKCNVMSAKTFMQLNIDVIKTKPDTSLKSYSGHSIKPKYAVNLPCTYKNKKSIVKFYIVDINATTVLGGKASSYFGLIKRLYTVQTEENELIDSNEINEIPKDIKNKYADVFKGIGCIPGEHAITIDSTVKPVVHAPRKIPLALKDKVRDELKRMEENDIIVKQTEPTAWVNSMVTVIKPNNKVRICIDPKDLNRAIKRPHYPLKTIEEVIANMPEAKVFSKIDAVNGFWQLKLTDESSKLCTFNTPFGRYRFKRLPFGINSASEVFQKAMSEMFDDIEGAVSIIDDVLIWGKDLQEDDERLQQVLGRVRENNLKLSPGKCEFRKNRISYVGHVLTSEGVVPDPEKIRAVEAMNPPENKTELHTFLGFIAYLTKFIPNMSEVSAPLRLLLEKNTSWHWDEQQQSSFQKLKLMATNSPVLRYFDPKLPLTLSVDASQKGLGAVILQEGKPIAYASRALTTCQQRYAQIEKETLAIVYGCQKFHQYIYGRKVTVETDHKPLQAIFRKPLYQTPPRLQRLLLILQKYDLDIGYKPGKLMFIADHLSRNFLLETKEDLTPDLTVNELSLISYLPISDEMYAKFQTATADDRELQELLKTISEGWPSDKQELPKSMTPYWTFRDEISCVDGLLFKSHKLVVPKNLQKEMLTKIHESHMGINKCKSRARDILFWNGMASQIEDLISKCSICQENQKSQSKEPMITAELPERPWSKVAADIFHLNDNNYMLIVDYYSKWPDIHKLDNMSSKNTIAYVKSTFSRCGVPDILVTDNAKQFSSQDFKDFAKEYGFQHTTSSPTYAQSNGQAERTVQTVKSLLKKSKDPYLALLDYRNTEITDLRLSPAQIFYGRRLKTKLPTTTPLLKENNTQDIRRKLKERQNKQKHYYDKQSKPLEPLKNGQKVLIHDGEKWSKSATVKRKHRSPRSYVVQTSNGRFYRRNRRHLRPTNSHRNQLSDDENDQIHNEVINTSQRNESSTCVTQPPVKTTRSGRNVQMPSKFDDYVR